MAGIGYTATQQNTCTGAGCTGYAAQPRSSIELPRDPRPSFEVPAYNGVQPYPVQGNPVPPQGQVGYGYGYGYALPYATGYYPGAPDAAYAPGYDSPGYDDGNQGAAASAPQDRQGVPDPGYAPEPRRPYAGQPGSDYAEGGGRDQSRRAPYTGGAAASSGPLTDGLEHPPVTLVFQDGRAPQQVTSYVLTGTTMYVLDGQRQRQIPLAELDVAKTVEVNRKAGVDFSLPGRP